MARTLGVLLSSGVSAFLFLLAMPPMDQSYLAWFAFVPLLVAVRGLGGAMGFLCGLGTCLLAALICSANILYPAVVADANNGWVFTGLAVLGVLVGVITGIFGELKTLKPRQVVALAFGAVLLEWASGILLTANIGITQYHSAMMLMLSSFGGIWLVSFMIWLSNIAIGAALAAKNRISIAASLLMAVAISGIGSVRLPPKPISENSMRLAAIQAAEPLRDELIKLNSEAGAKGAQLVVWPELSGSTFVSGGDTAPLRKLAATPRQPPFVTSFEDTASPPHNVAAMFFATGESQHYEKRRLFGGERAIRQPGSQPASHEAVGLNICFDSCYPFIIRDTALLPGVAVVALPNHDPASPNGFVQASHAAYTPFRAAENGVAMVRADSSGYSMIVDSTGAIVVRAKLGTAEIVVADIETTPRPTFYKLYGDWFLWLCAATVLVAVLARLIRRR